MRPAASLWRIAVAVALSPVAGPTPAAATVVYPVVDTGQDACYDVTAEIACPAAGEALYGQDAQHLGNPPAYALSGDGLTVHDDNTGLTWIRTPDTDGDGDLDSYDQLTWSEFLAFPATLNAQSYGGYDDWRAPSIKELYSLIDFRGLDPSGPNPPDLVPFIDTTYFDFCYGDESLGERLIDAQYWSTSQYVGTVFGGQTAVFGVNFADGRIKGYPRDMGPGGVAVHYARYVRGNADYGTNEFLDNGDGTITDEATGLMWSQDDYGGGTGTGPRSGMTWEEALARVQQMNDDQHLGHDDWRLPDAKEMQSILDYSRAPDATGTAAIDPLFHITQITNEGGAADYPWFWTGTTHARADGTGPSAAYVCFGRALGYVGGSWLDVHGAGAQRSDEKDGDLSGFSYAPDGYYFALSPQGDACRLYNYIRLVRDAGGTTGASAPGERPERLSLRQNRPNPFAPSTRIEFALSEAADVRLEVLDVSGHRLRVLIDRRMAAGTHAAIWDGRDESGLQVASGTYFHRLRVDGATAARKMTLLR